MQVPLLLGRPLGPSRNLQRRGIEPIEGHAFVIEHAGSVRVINLNPRTVSDPARPGSAAGRTSTGRSTPGSSPTLYVAGRVLSQAFEFALWVVAVNRLTLAEAGVLAVALLAARYAGFLADWGATFTGSREVAQHGDSSGGVATLLRRREIATLVSCAAFIGGIVLYDQLVMWPLVGTILFRGLNRDWISLGVGKSVVAATSNLIAQSLALVIGLAAPASWLPGAFGLGAVVGLAFSLRTNPRAGVETPGSGSSGSGWYVIAGLAGLIYTTADTFMLGALRTAEEVAVYSSVYRLPNAWLLVVGLSVGALVPRIAARLAAAPGERAKLRSNLSKVSVLCAFALVAATPVVLWLSPLLFGPEFSAGKTPLAILMVATAATTIGAPFQILVIVDGSDRSAAVAMAIAACLNILANLVAIPMFGMTGAATTTLVTQALPAVYYWSSSRRNPA